MTKRSVGFDEVVAACEQLAAEGVTPSTLSVYKVLGKGSYTTIQKWVQQWSGAQEQTPSLQSPELPTAFNAAATTLIKSIYTQAQQEYASSINQINKEKDIALQEAEAKIKEAIEIAEDQAEKNENLRQQMTALKAEINQLQAQQQQRETLHAAMLESLVVSHNEAIASKTKTIELLEARIAELVK